ncbi:MAG: hypothetical protein ABFD60_01685 [Bryobacteraceae bacterium]
MPARLINLKLERIDLVDEPANPGSKVLLYKRAAEKSAPADDRPGWYAKEADVHLSQTDQPLDVQGTARRKSKAAAEECKVGNTKKKSLFKRLLSVLKEAEAVDPEALREWAEGEGEGEGPEHVDAGVDNLGMLKAFYEKLGTAIGTYGDGAGLAADHPVHALKALHKEIGDHLAVAGKEAEARKEAAAKEAAAKEAEAGDEEMGPGVTKRFTALEKRAQAAEKRAEEAENIAKAERTARIVEGEKTNLLKFKGLTVNPETDAALLVGLEASSPAVAKRVREILEGAEAAVAKNNLLSQELGTGRGGATGGTAWAEIEAEAAKLVQKDNKLTKEGAINLVMQRNPALVKRYNAEEAAGA